MNESTFKKAYHTARREAFGHAVGLLQRYALAAVNTLVKVMTDECAGGVVDGGRGGVLDGCFAGVEI